MPSSRVPFAKAPPIASELTEMRSIPASMSIDRIEVLAEGQKPEIVGAVVARELIGAEASPHNIVAIAAIQNVISVGTRQMVIPFAA